MSTVGAYALVIVASYLYGAIPWGFVVARGLYQTDIRQHGSGNIGFTNVLRTVGVRAGALVLFLDIGKGVLPVLTARLIWGDPNLQVAGAVAAVAGHSWPVYLGFRGGKGVATGSGAVLAMAPLPFLAIAAVGLPFLAVSRYVSLTVLIFAPAMSALMLALALLDLTSYSYFVFVAAATAIIVYRHRDNIRRLRAGTESKLGRRAGGATT